MVEVLLAQVNARRGQYMYGPIENLLETGKQQFELGEAAGIEFALRFPQQMVNGLEDELEMLPEENEGDFDVDARE